MVLRRNRADDDCVVVLVYEVSLCLAYSSYIAVLTCPHKKRALLMIYSFVDRPTFNSDVR
jgi:hypothetical protein